MKIIIAEETPIINQNGDFSSETWSEGLKNYLRKQNSEEKVLSCEFKDDIVDNLENIITAKDIIVFNLFDIEDQKNNSLLIASIRKVKEIGAVPILSTPINFNVKKNLNKKTYDLEKISQSIKKIAKNEGISIIDFYNFSEITSKYKIADKHEMKCFSLFSNTEEDEKDERNLNSLSENGANYFGRYAYLKLRNFISDKNQLFEKYYYGACMYPEVWNEDVVRADIKHMKKIGMNFSRIGEFMWSKLEPSENDYNMNYLRKVLKLYQEANIDIVLGIPTPTPPRWLTFKHKERLVRDMNGQYMEHGSRQHVCTNNTYFRDRAYLLTRQITNVVNEFPNVIGIQLDNEFKCHVDLCFCDTCVENWHSWLESQYGSIANLNDSWGTKIWSEEYCAFDQVPTPTATPFLHNSSLMNAYRKFNAETINEFAQGLCNIIRMESDVPITHNTALGFNLLNDELFSELDYVGFDTYAPASRYAGYTLNLDLWKNLKKNQSEYMLLETSTSHAGHIENYIAPHPKGYLTNEAFLGFASGLKAFNFWHFRGHRYGVEQPHSTVITAWGEPDCGYDEVVKIGNMIKKITPLLEESKIVKSKIAIIYSDKAKRFFNTETGGTYNYRDVFTEFYESIIKQGISVEVIQENEDFNQFDVIFAPFLRSVSDVLIKKMRAWSENGGYLILGPLTGDRTDEIALPEKNGLGNIGIWLDLSNVKQFLVNTENDKVKTGNHLQEEIDKVVTIFTPSKNAKSLLDFGEESIASTCKKGKGEVVYLGCLFKNLSTSTWWIMFLNNRVRRFDINKKYISIKNDIFVYQREMGQSIYLFLSNMNDAENILMIHSISRELLNDSVIKSGKMRIGPRENLILLLDK